MLDRVYFDNASTTNIHPEVLKSYISLLQKYYVNSESIYNEGIEINSMMEKARRAIAGLLGVQASDVILLLVQVNPTLPQLKAFVLQTRTKTYYYNKCRTFFHFELLQADGRSVWLSRDISSCRFYRLRYV